ncbi:MULTISPECIES: type II toxin-antitoxin system VapC family toxin [unclassified Archaeoglobus]|jgi:hypothetical protein|uniref:type II toxin-antitoxin system VapC family toxin n=1 Tax=unclassified Archaeoglobus TaxID=2643606 RepID=UPI0025C49043|nr:MULTISPECIES: type II toxin-antitoxin system VapC family toxin [unclassified Archaeoglobus]
MKIFIDTSVFIRHYYGHEIALKFLDFAINENKAVISPNVIEELFFKLLYIETERIFGKTGRYSVADKFAKYSSEYEPVRIYLKDFILTALDSDIIEMAGITKDITESSVDLAFRYGLLPNDALIAATCRHYGIRKIATFDEDFKRVDFLEVIEV